MNCGSKKIITIVIFPCKQHERRCAVSKSQIFRGQPDSVGSQLLCKVPAEFLGPL